MVGVQKILCILGILCWYWTAEGQTDTEFWFVAPEVTEDHSDNPILLWFSSYEQAAEISISQPANPAFAPIVITVPPRSTRSVDLSDRIDQLENKPANRILPFGTRILSTATISAYYEISGFNNPDILALKGRNALGNEFIIPAQNIWNNFTGFDIEARSGFDIVAVEDHTQIRIILSQDAIGHPAGRPFDIILQRGESYAIWSEGQNAIDRLGGSIVRSNRPISITIKDDSQNYAIGGTCTDLGADQLVPLSILGNEYIVPKGNLNGSDQVFIMATEDQTEIYLRGNSDPVTVLNRGEIHRESLIENALYITSNKPISILHATGINCEIGHAIIPPLKCSGSREVAFTRSSNEEFAMVILTHRNYIEDFIVEGVTLNIQPTDFTPVMGTNDSYMVARLAGLSIPTNQAFRVINRRGSFHFGIQNGSQGTRYGYFSDFRQLYINPRIASICTGEKVNIVINGYEKYLWSPHSPTPLQGDTFILKPPASTLYRVIAQNQDGTCLDSAEVFIQVNQVFFQEDSLNVCSGDTLVVENKQITRTGTYTFAYPTRTECDSTYIYHVSFKDTLSFNENVRLCKDNSIVLFDQLVTSPGIHQKTFQSQSGCDSIHTYVVEQINTVINRDTIMKCQGESAEIFNEIRYNPGIFSQSFVTIDFCDSIQEFHFMWATPYSVKDTITICHGESIDILGMTVTMPGYYERMYTSTYGCDSLQAYQVNMVSPEEYYHLPTKISISYGQSLPWDIRTFTGQAIDFIQWTPVTGLSCSDCPNPTFNLDKSERYTLFILDQNCPYEYQFDLEVVLPKVFIPNVFSPNGDQVNDQLKIFTPTAVQEIKSWKIFDRWGNLVFEVKNRAETNSITWDGRFNGHLLNPSVFVWISEVEYINGESKLQSGNVTLIR